MSVELDMTAFDAALRKYVAESPSDLEDIVNTKLLYVARGALERTPKADRSSIEQALEVVGYKASVSKKTGNFKRRGAILGSGSLLYRLVNARRRRAGEKGLKGKEMAAAARKLLGARLRAIGSLKAGWIRPIQILAARVKESMGSTGGLPRVKGRGTATPANASWNPIAEMTYEVTERKGGGGDQIDPRVEAALQQSFDAEARSMEEYISRKVQERLDTISG